MFASTVRIRYVCRKLRYGQVVPPHSFRTAFDIKHLACSHVWVIMPVQVVRFIFPMAPKAIRNDR